MIVAKKKNKITSGNGLENILAGISLIELTTIIAEYNRKHNTSYTYGQFVSLESMGKIKIERI